MLIRAASPSDSSAVADVALAAGQPTEESGADVRYFDLLLRTGTVLLAEAQAGVVGWGATRISRGASMLTDLFVHPAHHGEGIGTRLLDALWPSGAGSDRGRFTFSSLHPHALPLYVRAGLVPAWPLLYLVGASSGAPRNTVTVDVVAQEKAAALEERLGGRGGSGDVELYRYWAEKPTAAAVALSDGGHVVASGAIRRGEVVHLSCAEGADVVRIIAAAVFVAGPEVRLCVPGPHPALRALLGWGFRVEEMDIAMSMGRPLSTRDIYSPGLG